MRVYNGVISRNVRPRPPGAQQRRTGFKFVTDVPGPVVRLESVQRGNWVFLRVHMENGETMLINSDGGPVVIQGK